MKLHYDPFQIFRGSQTPAGLYARQKWLGEAETPAWQTDFKARVNDLLANQSADGSWQHASVETVRRLFGLHLTLRSANNAIEKALVWLLNQIKSNQKGLHTQDNTDVAHADLSGLPFVLGGLEMLLTGATLFLASIFNRQSDPTVVGIYRRLCKVVPAQEGLSVDIASMHNIFRALVVHPVFAKDDLTTQTVAIYAKLQTAHGDWGKRVPFYQALNALAHLDSPAAEAQVERAFARLLQIQDRDGTWGQREPEWNTFLSIHALKNKGVL